MKKTIGNIGIMIICLAIIIYWLYNGMNNNKQELGNHKKTNESANLIFEILQKDPSLNLKSMQGYSNIKYHDSTNFINILKNQETIDINIGQIAPSSTSDFLSLSYKKNTLNNYKNYLKNNNNFSNWNETKKTLNSDYNFYLPELAGYINEIGFFTNNNITFYYLETEEPYNVSSILEHIKDTSGTYVSERKKYYKIHIDSLFQLLAGKLFTEKRSCYLTVGNYFVFASDTTQLHDINRSFLEGNSLERNSAYLNYKRNQSSKYGLHYYSDITQEDDINNTIISYQLRGEKKNS